MEMFRHESAIHLVKTNIEEGERESDVRSSVRETAGRKFTVIFISGTFIGALQFSYRTR